jgi:TolB protein
MSAPNLFRRLGLAFGLVLALFAAAPGVAWAQLEVNVNEGVQEPLPIAVPDFAGTQGSAISQVITANLQRSGLFRPIDPAAFIERNLNVATLPQFEQWKQIGAQALVVGQATVDGDGRLRVDVRLYDTPGGREIFLSQGGGIQFTATPDSWRRIAHKVSDIVYEKLTGEPGYFDTRIVFVAESGSRAKRVKRLAIMDQDGANPSYLTDGSYIVMTPRFSSTSQEITYMALRESGSSIYLFNIDTGRQETLGRFTGMVFAPRFSPDGGRVAYSVERGGNSDVYVMDLRSRAQFRLTSDPAIDTSPSFSPDGSQIVFNSDRGGQPQLYVMSASGGAARRISYGSGRYTTPVWSPRGDYIAFTKQSGGLFSIGIMRPDGSGERILSTSGLEEGPTWAPNGRVLMFFRESSGGAKLWMVDITGRVSQAAPYPGSGSDPAWSPLLK